MHYAGTWSATTDLQLAGPGDLRRGAPYVSLETSTLDNNRRRRALVGGAARGSGGAGRLSSVFGRGRRGGRGGRRLHGGTGDQRGERRGQLHDPSWLTLTAAGGRISGFQTTISGAPGSWPSFAASATTDTTNAGNIAAAHYRTRGLPALQSGDIPSNAANTSGSAGSLSGTISQGGVYAGPASGDRVRPPGAPWCQPNLPATEAPALSSAQRPAASPSRPSRVIFVGNPNGVTFDECGLSLQTMPTVQSVDPSTFRRPRGVHLRRQQVSVATTDTPGVAKLSGDLRPTPADGRQKARNSSRRCCRATPAEWRRAATSGAGYTDMTWGQNCDSSYRTGGAGRAGGSPRRVFFWDNHPKNNPYSARGGFALPE